MIGSGHPIVRPSCDRCDLECRSDCVALEQSRCVRVSRWP